MLSVAVRVLLSLRRRLLTVAVGRLSLRRRLLSVAVGRLSLRRRLLTVAVGRLSLRRRLLSVAVRIRCLWRRLLRLFLRLLLLRRRVSLRGALRAAPRLCGGVARAHQQRHRARDDGAHGCGSCGAGHRHCSTATPNTSSSALVRSSPTKSS